MCSAPYKGEVIGEYEIIRTMGQGAFSHTYLARSRTGATVILKFPHVDLIGDPTIYERFRREFQIGQQLSHPAISRTLALQESPVGPYLVSQYVEGISFREYLTKHAPLPLQEALSIARQTVEALAYIHSKGISHRDLKPENLVVSPDGRIHVVDFGIALLLGARRLTWQLLSKFSVLGTPDYMAPEQIQGRRGDARTDIYALGMILFEMLTGTVPFHGDNPLAVMNQHLTAPFPSPRRSNPEIPPAIEGIIFKAVRRDPEDRYQNAESLLHDLDHYSELDLSQFQFEPDRPVVPVHSSRSYVLVGVAVGIGFLLVGALAVLITLWLKNR